MRRLTIRRMKAGRSCVGALYVGPEQVAMDRASGSAGSTVDRAVLYGAVGQNLSQPPCRVRSLGDCFAESFNDVEAYRQTDQRFTEMRSARS